MNYGLSAEDQKRMSDQIAQQQNAAQAAEDQRKKALEAYNAWRPSAVNPYSGGGQPVSSGSYMNYLSQQNRDQANRSALANQAGLISPQQFAREQAIGRGQERAAGWLVGDPDMMATRDRLQDLSKGYSGQELGALRQQARGEIAGQRSSYLNQLAGRTARSGVGGARAAAMQGAADQGFARAGADAERKMALDNAQMVRSGTKDLSDYLMRQRFGVLAGGLGEAGLQSQENAYLAQMAAANDRGEKGFLSNLLDSIF